MTAIQEKIMSVDDYIAFELTSELRHEYINGQLFEMPGEQVINSAITNFLTAYLSIFLYEQGFRICSNVIKVVIPGEGRIYYPDWFITKEVLTDKNRYVQYEPEMIVEIVSKTSRTRDNVDKYIDYIKIPALKYYMIIDPDRIHVTLHSKNSNGEWEAEVYSNKEETIQLSLLELKLPLNKIYR